MTNDPHDQKSELEFEQDLEAVRSSWRVLENTEPPDLLDRAVLNTARRELEHHRKRRPWRWLGAFSTAAVVVLALTIVVQQDERPPTPALDKSDGFMLDQAAPAARKREQDRDDYGEKAGPGESTSQPGAETGGRTGTRTKQSAASPAAPASNVAAIAIAEDMARAPVELEEKADRIPEADAWIERLIFLRETQQDEKLISELATFREAYPDYPLPPELE